MKLTEAYFFPVVTDEGVNELYNYCDSILFKAGRRIPLKDLEDVRQEMVVRCLEVLPQYDSKKCVLGGFLYWQCRGAISVWANRHKKEIPCLDAMIENRKMQEMKRG